MTANDNRRHDSEVARHGGARWPARRLAWLALGSLFLPLLVACRAKTVEELRADRERTMGTIVGNITDAESGAPLEKMVVLVQNFHRAFTHEDGHFAIRDVSAGKVVVRALRRDRTPTSAGVTVVPGQVSTVTLRSTKAPLPCCRLAGSWNLILVMERSDHNGSLPRQALGTIRFGDTTPPVLENLHQAYAKEDPTLDEFGVSAFDLRPFGPRFTGAVSPTESISAAANAELPEARLHAYGYVHEGDQVFIVMGSDVDDSSGLTLEGRIEGKVIRGRWEHHEVWRHGTDEGSFVMTRVAPP